MSAEAKWYVIHTYSGYEKKVEDNIRKMVENRNLEDQIVNIRVPEEVEYETHGDKIKEIRRKLYPSYVFIQMKMSDDVWHAIRNIRGVTGFVGPESKPVPLTQREYEEMRLNDAPVSCEYSVGEVVNIISGPLSGNTGRVLEISSDFKHLKLAVDLFMGRETTVEAELRDVAPLQ